MVFALPPANIDLPIHHIATEEAVSLEARLALVARRREQVSNIVFQRLAEIADSAPPASTGLAVDKTA